MMPAHRRQRLRHRDLARAIEATQLHRLESEDRTAVTKYMYLLAALFHHLHFSIQKLPPPVAVAADMY